MACKRRQKYTTMDFAIGLSSPSGLPCERSCILGQSWAFVRRTSRLAARDRRGDTAATKYLCMCGRAGGGGEDSGSSSGTCSTKKRQAGLISRLLRQESWRGAHASQHSGKQFSMHDPTCPHRHSTCSSSNAWSRGARPDEWRKGEGQGQGNAWTCLRAARPGWHA